jgi:hypothetical protein
VNIASIFSMAHLSQFRDDFTCKNLDRLIKNEPFFCSDESVSDTSVTTGAGTIVTAMGGLLSFCDKVWCIEWLAGCDRFGV